MMLRPNSLSFFFFNDTATTEIYTLSLHDALPICPQNRSRNLLSPARVTLSEHQEYPSGPPTGSEKPRSEEHTSELQSHLNLVCRLLLEKKKATTTHRHTPFQSQPPARIMTLPTRS